MSEPQQAGMRPSNRSIAAWLGLVVVLWFVNGIVGVMVGVAIGCYLLLKLEARMLVAMSFVLFACVPLFMIAQGLTSRSTIDPRIVGSYRTSNNFAFAGLVCLVVGVVLSDRQGRPRPHRREHAHDERPHIAMTTPIGVALSQGEDAGVALSLATEADELAAAEAAELHGGEPGEEQGDGSRTHMLKGAGWMMINVIIQAIGGAGFWLVASRFYPTETVGLATALFSSLLFVNFVTGMGLPVTIPLFAGGRSRDDTTILTWALVYTAATSAVGTVIYLAVVSSEAVALLKGEGGPLGWFIFFFSVLGASLAAIADVRLMTARRWGLVLGRNTAVAAARFAFLFIPHRGNAALWLFSVGALPTALSGVVALAVLPIATRIRYHLFPIPARIWAAFRFATVNFFGTLSSQAPTFVLPIIVLANVSADANAQFFLAWSAASIVFLFPTTMAQVLLVESPGHESRAAKARFYEALAIGIGVVLLALLCSLPRWGVVTRVYGPAYSMTATMLPAFILAGIPWTYTAIALTRARLRKDSQMVIGTTVTLGAVVIIAALSLVPAQGTDGAVKAWVVGQFVAAIAAFVFDQRWTRSNRRARDLEARLPEIAVTEDGDLIVTEPQR